MRGSAIKRFAFFLTILLQIQLQACAHKNAPMDYISLGFSSQRDMEFSRDARVSPNEVNSLRRFNITDAQSYYKAIDEMQRSGFSSKSDTSTLLIFLGSGKSNSNFESPKGSPDQSKQINNNSKKGPSNLEPSKKNINRTASQFFKENSSKKQPADDSPPQGAPKVAPAADI